MGSGYSCICWRCHKFYDVDLGIGFEYFDYYEQLKSEIKEGIYGAELKSYADAHENFEVDGERTLFYCEKCGTWEVTEPKDIYVAKKETSDIPFHSSLLDRTKYELVYENHIACKKCGQTMKRLYEDDFLDIKKKVNINGLGLRCPKCGRKFIFTFESDWD